MLFFFVFYLEICVQRTCSGAPRGRSWAGLGVASRRSADAVGGSLRAGGEPRWGRGGRPSLGTPGPGSGTGTWPVAPGSCSLRHLSSGWSNLEPWDGSGPRPSEGSPWRPETLSWSSASLQTKTSSLEGKTRPEEKKSVAGGRRKLPLRGASWPQVERWGRSAGSCVRGLVLEEMLLQNSTALQMSPIRGLRGFLRTESKRLQPSVRLDAAHGARWLDQSTCQ